MALTVTSTNGTKKTFKKVTRIIVTPFVDGGEAGLKKGETAYALDNIVADSTKIDQDDATREEVACETRDENIDEIVTLGKYKFECANADWQDSLMTALLGFTKDNTSGVVYAPESYVEVYAEIELQFGDAAKYKSASDTGGYKGSIILPKVLLNSKATLESLKTSLAKMAIAGTAYSGPVNGITGTTAPFYMSPGPVAK